MLPQAILVVAPLDDQPSEKRLPPPLPRFYPHSEWAAVGPVHVEVRFQAQVRHKRNEPGLLGCCHLAIDLWMDQPIIRSHPNKAVDDVEAP